MQTDTAKRNRDMQEGRLVYMVVITAANEKGGVCKTTSVALLARGLAARGSRVLVIDLDPQRGNVSRALGGNVDDYAGTYELLCRPKEFTLDDCVQQIGERVGLVAARAVVEAYATVYDQTGKEQNVKRALRGADNKYDYVLIDTPPKIKALSDAAMIASDYVLVPSTPTQASVEGCAGVNNKVEEIQDYYNPDLKILCVAPMMVDTKATNVQKRMMQRTESLAEAFSIPVLPVAVPRAKVIQECIDYRQDWTDLPVDEGRNKAIARCWDFVDAFTETLKDAESAR